MRGLKNPLGLSHFLSWLKVASISYFFPCVSGVTFPPGFSGCKPVGCPNPCLPPTCSTVCSTGIQCSNPVTSLPFVSTPVVAPTVPVIPMSYPAPPIYFPAPYPATQPMPVPAPCPVQCVQHTPQFCPAYCPRRCCRAGVPLTRAGKRSGIKRPYHRLVLKTKRNHQKQLKNKPWKDITKPKLDSENSSKKRKIEKMAETSTWWGMTRNERKDYLVAGSSRTLRFQKPYRPLS